MNSLPILVEQYLKKYSVGNWKLEPQFKNTFDNIIVIPVIAEYDNLRRLFISLLSNDEKYFRRSAIIIVVNNTPDSSDEVKNDNQKTLNFLKTLKSNSASDETLVEQLGKSGLNVGFIDASSTGFEMPKKIGGVGLARKIGMDEALKIFDYSSSAKKIFICLDADCAVDPNYLTTVVEEFNRNNLFAAVVKFKHNVEENSPTTQAIICYEIFLHYYVLGLKYANSPFAFHTVGSTMICDHKSYIKVEGMNKQKAAEDFYFLEKLAKNFKIEKINSTTVYPSSRSSWRVPFGTGQRVKRFLSHSQNEYLLYDPSSFDILKQWLIIFSSDSKTSGDYLEQAKNIHPDLSNFLIEQNFESDWNRIGENSTTAEQLAKQKHKWFDGFRTLKLIHFLRDKAFPQIDMFEALNGMFERVDIKENFFWFEKRIPQLDVQKKYLKLLRELT